MHHAEAMWRIERALARPTYFVPTRQVDPRFRAPLERLAVWMAAPDFDGELASARVRAWRDEGALDDERMWSALSVVATHPRVRAYEEAARCIALQENAALGGSRDMSASLASVERHRGVLAFCMGRPEVALECFLAALERERTAENLGNVLAALVRLGELDEAEDLLARVRTALSPELVDEVERIVAIDEDLAPLR